jgi:hypothetical protein
VGDLMQFSLVVGREGGSGRFCCTDFPDEIML